EAGKRAARKAALKPPGERAAPRECAAPKATGQIPSCKRTMRETAGGLPALERSARGPALQWSPLQGATLARQPLQLSGSAAERIASRQLGRAATHNIAIGTREFIWTRKLRAANFPSTALERIGAVELADTTFRGATDRLALLLGSARALVRA